MNIAYEIERLLRFGLNKKLLAPLDVVPTRNALLDLLRVKEPYARADGGVIEENGETAGDILTNMLDYCAAEGLLADDNMTCRDLMDARIMGLLMPRASEVAAHFAALESGAPELATNYFYNISRDSNYIQVDRIKKNLYWETATEFGNLEITVNLSKPEKDSKEIALMKSAPQTNYPPCVLCKENAGFAGHMNHPARQNLRLIPMKLDGEDWYMQYSPYVYYNEHCIVLLGEHIPMLVNEKTIRRLLDFVERFPHYFLGSNAGLPIVGGSILTHDHYQGGRHVFPMERAAREAEYTHADFPGCTAALIKWPMAAVRLACADKAMLTRFAVHVMKAWDGHTDEAAGIFAFTDGTPHNAVTPIARRLANGDYELDIVLRNNLTSEEHPLGVYHPHAQLHHIKKENIGLIEVMGLAVLPGRLESELAEIRAILTAGESFVEAPIAADEEHPLYKHLPWIRRLVAAHGTHMELDAAERLVRDEVGHIFELVLRDAGVYKYTPEGRTQLAHFMSCAGFAKVEA